MDYDKVLKNIIDRLSKEATACPSSFNTIKFSLNLYDVGIRYILSEQPLPFDARQIIMQMIVDLRYSQGMELLYGDERVAKDDKYFISLIMSYLPDDNDFNISICPINDREEYEKEIEKLELR